MVEVNIMKNERGEIITILTFATLIVIGLSTVISTLFLQSSKNKLSSNPRASVNQCECVDGVWNNACADEGLEPGSLCGPTDTPVLGPTRPPVAVQPPVPTEARPIGSEGTIPSCTSCNEQRKCIYYPELDPRSGQAPPGTPQCTDNGCIHDDQCQKSKGSECVSNTQSCSIDADCCSGLTCAEGERGSKRCIPIPIPLPSCQSQYTDQKTCDANCSKPCIGVPFKGGYIPNCWQCQVAKSLPTAGPGVTGKISEQAYNAMIGTITIQYGNQRFIPGKFLACYQDMTATNGIHCDEFDALSKIDPAKYDIACQAGTDNKMDTANCIPSFIAVNPTAGQTAAARQNIIDYRNSDDYNASLMHQCLVNRATHGCDTAQGVVIEACTTCHEIDGRDTGCEPMPINQGGTWQGPNGETLTSRQVRNDKQRIILRNLSGPNGHEFCVR